MAGDGDLQKVTFDLEPNSWHGHASESVWAKPLGGGRYEIRNVPFYATGVSFGDVVTARHSEGRLVVSSVSSRGGHSTYRIILQDDINDTDFQNAWLPIQRLGSTYEQATSHLFGIDVPPEADVGEVYRLLKTAQNEGIWDLEEGHYGHPRMK